jgi:hypothetical protein
MGQMGLPQNRSMSSPRKPKPVRLNLKSDIKPMREGEVMESPSSILAPQLADISIPKSYSTLDLKVKGHYI